ncbi:DNA polymerase III, delta subunit [Candidatus Ruthia magnifica str. Cm (Calyptogena magnifica)]|uniref:DNA polymerase III subunit delta n=1 Tax=Ruthia magnifica subsp. Calyptogena magnifica TaxID=413404 RepID=A1AVH1_RUTMC|nr:DNA polymerase III subunit delta [Candidatus Ruthturnera calyptogenae]ABL01928.1 DNA polymerase III, delta subunit [Candidatus Ruthia magnifica str. Cm (Calyptogena magnifica)]
MKIKPQQLNIQLVNKLDTIYFIFGAEILLIEQSLAQINKTAKKVGFDERISFDIDANFDWNQIFREISAVSLFSPKCIIKCRLKTGKIGIKGAKALTEIASTLPDDILLIVSTGKLDMAQQKSKWFKTLEQLGTVVQHFEMQSNHLVDWIANHMAELGLEANTEIAQSIAFCTEGNLTASMQEIQKLKMAYPNGKINTQEYLEQANQQSKYTVYGLIDAALFGNSNQVNKIYQTLISDTIMPIQLSNSLYLEIKSIIEMSVELIQVKNINIVLQNNRVWNKRKPIITNILKRHSYQRLQKLLLSLGRIDRSIKGMDNLNVIDELHTLLLSLAGKTQWTQ